jgi:hypothetical protein
MAGGSPFAPPDVDGGDHVLRAGAAEDQPGPLVDHGIPHRGPIAVLSVVWTDEVAFEAPAQLIGDASPHLVVDLGQCGRSHARRYRR